MRRLTPALLLLAPAFLLLALAGCAQTYDARPIQIAGPTEHAFSRRGGRLGLRAPARQCAMPALDDAMLASRLIDASLADTGLILPEVVVFDCARPR